MTSVQLHESSNATLTVTVTDAALKHFKKQLKGQEFALGVRLSTKKAGCSGLKYVIDFVSQVSEQDLSFAVDASFSVFVPRLDLPFLKGSVIDYIQEGLNGSIRIKNPNERGSCGCGESFAIDDSAQIKE